MESLAFSANVADQFIAEYFNRFTNQRDSLSTLYTDTSSVLWNGSLYTGQQAIASLLTALPRCTFSLHSYDAQPVVNANNITMVTGTGYVQFAQTTPRPFAHTFFLLHNQNSLWIQSECMRFL